MMVDGTGNIVFLQPEFVQNWDEGLYTFGDTLMAGQRDEV